MLGQTIVRAVGALFLLALLGGLPATAQTTLTAFGGYAGSGTGLKRSAAGASAGPADQALRLDAGTAASFSVDWTLDTARQLQLLISQQRSALDTQGVASAGAPQRIALQLIHVHLGGTNFLDARVGHGVYVVGGLGFTRFSPGVAGFVAELRASMNVGVGYAWPLSPWLGLRAELRGFATLIDSSGSFLCSGGCAVSIEGDTLTQPHALLGLAFSF
ncbi:MAG: hypothetical protein WA210_22935 [Burkholderiaceae bacterium]